MDVKEKLMELSDIQVLQREIECVKRKSYTNCTDCFNCDLLMTDERILSAYANAIDALQNANGVTVQEWISVKDRLPEAVGYVVCIAKRNPFSRFMPMVARIEKNGWVNPMTEQYISEVTHWMPLPPPPKGE